MVDGSGAILTEQELVTKKENQDSCKEGGRGEGGRERGERETGVGREGREINQGLIISITKDTNTHPSRDSVWWIDNV